MPYPSLWQDVGVSDTTSGYPGAPPGWYPDPAGGPGQRWWDGYAWDEATILPQSPPPPPQPQWGAPPTHPAGAPGQQPPWAVASAHLAVYNTSGLVAAETSMAPIARLAVAMPGVYYLVSLINQRVDSAKYLSIGHQFRLIWEAAQHGTTAPTLNDTATVNPITLLVGLLTVAAVVIGCIWQHRAASAARAFGLPTTHSPAWGVGSWFVPIVNFWMPYQAIRDCLPPEDPARPLVLRWWLALVGTWVMSGAAGAAAFFSSGTALVFTVPAAVLCLGVIATAPHVVTAIANAHRTALERSGQATAVSG
jgi:hypothetical protein